jgi:lipopolysaccharide/colanic/teichoic acid biosynthesis glycosyltransferase
MITGTVLKRAFDVFFSFIGLILLSPLLLTIAMVLKLSERGPVFYHQRRIGLRGRPFLIHKFRTMAHDAEKTGPSVTRDGDSRITRLGRILRKTKLDELPQLWNVIKGEMSLVGPRPEVPEYVAQYRPEQRAILNLKPGITDLASIYFRNEEMLLKHADHVEAFYLQHCVPRKVQLNLDYARRANLFTDAWIIVQTLCPYWITLLSAYSLVLSASFYAACQLAYDFHPPPNSGADLPLMVAIVALQLGALVWRKQCKGLLSYFSLPELKQVAVALGFSSLLSLVLGALTGWEWAPASLILIDAIVSLCALGGFRLLLRWWRERSSLEADTLPETPRRVGIIGAGKRGSLLARQLVEKHSGRTVVAFFDDDCQKWYRRVHEIPVVGMPECVVDGWAANLDEVIIALPESASRRVREIRELVENVGLRVYASPPSAPFTINHLPEAFRL